jgi:hypothetical protein
MARKRHTDEAEVQMSATPSPTQLFLADASATEPSSEEALYATDPENDQFTNDYPSAGKRVWFTLVCCLITAGIGIGTTLAWKSYGGLTTETIEPTASFKEISPDLLAVRLSIDALATSVGTNQAHMMRSIDKLAASQEQITREIVKLREIEQNVLSKNSEPPAQPATPPARKPVPRSSQAPIAPIPARNP